jgi:hypothetical protein
MDFTGNCTVFRLSKEPEWEKMEKGERESVDGKFSSLEGIAVDFNLR